MRKNKLILFILSLIMCFALSASVIVSVSASPVVESATLSDMIIRTAIKEGDYYTDATLVDYSVKHGSVTGTISNFTTYTSNATEWTGTLGEATDNAYAINWQICSQSNDGIIVAIKAKQKVKIEIASTGSGGWRESAIVSIYRYDSVAQKTLTLSSETYSTSNLETVGMGTFCIAQNDILYWQFRFEWTSHRNIQDLPNFTFTTAENSDELSVEPVIIEEPDDYTTATEIDIAGIVKNVVLDTSRKVELKDMTIALKSGKVVGGLTDLAKYITKVEDSQNAYYAVSTTDENDDILNNTKGPSFSSWRILTTLNKSAVIEIKAKSNIALTISHLATNGGWIDNTEQFIGLYVKSAEGKVYTIWERSVETNVNAENAFGDTVSVSSGDSCYWVFGTNVGTERNFDIEPKFSSNTDNYNVDEVTAYKSNESETVKMWDALTSAINNEYNDVEYSLINFGFYYGSIKEMTKFSYHLGDGTGTENDALWNSAAINGATGFQRWQIQCSAGADAIMKLTAKADVELTIEHTAIWSDAWSTHTTVRYYAIDSEGTRVQLFTKKVMSNTAENAYGIVANLKAGDSLVIDYYTNNDDWGSLNFAPVAKVTTENYDETKRANFAEVKIVNSMINEKVLSLQTIYDGYDKTLYTISKQAVLEDIYSSAVADLEEAQTIDAVNTIYNKAVTDLDEVMTKSEEAEELNAYKTQKTTELEEYVTELGKSNYSSKNWDAIQNEVETFKTSLENCLTKTAVNLRYNTAKTAIDEIPQTKGCSCGSELETVSLSIISLVCVALIFTVCKIKKETNKGKK